ncbi:hypothetical protein MTR_2g054850 [Medicago truncatula]|uniref:Uncharacterized protein n=1 Tax=Medicago truncatula TaxID=3880 RepID=A0A072V9D2_MEDTR|nr:hypothetical protein MTR_2g054850 [Medicago truncatula]
MMMTPYRNQPLSSLLPFKLQVVTMRIKDWKLCRLFILDCTISWPRILGTKCTSSSQQSRQ